jgi:hypothetical protein
MSKARRKRAAPQGRAATSRGRALAAVAVAAGAVAAAWLLWTPRSPVSPAPAAPASPSTAAPTFSPLIGSWVRPDGGYVLTVSGIAPEGAAAVSYFNPRPIRVGRAEARKDGAAVGLFVEFADRDYPGSTYTLAYDPQNDVLRGIYYQAVQRATYDVVFVRQR